MWKSSSPNRRGTLEDLKWTLVQGKIYGLFIKFLGSLDKLSVDLIISALFKIFCSGEGDLYVTSLIKVNGHFCRPP